MKNSFPMKHHLDYPDYSKNEELTRFWPTGPEKQLPQTTKMNYVIELLSNDRENFEQLVEISRIMSLNEVELRQLSNLKQLIVHEGPNASSISFDRLSTELESILRPYNDGKDIQDKIMAWLRKVESADSTNASFDRVNNLVEFLQCYPLEVKKNRNASNRMDDILHMRKEDTQKLGGLPPKAELDRAARVLMFIWRKMQDQSKNLAQAFKIFDSRDKGRLKKTDFIAGLDKYTI